MPIAFEINRIARAWLEMEYLLINLRSLYLNTKISWKIEEKKQSISLITCHANA